MTTHRRQTELATPLSGDRDRSQARIPLELLFGLPDRITPQIAPDGSRLAYVAPHEGVANVWIADLDLADPRVVTDDRDRGIIFFTWSLDSRSVLYLQDCEGDENWQLHIADTEVGGSRNLTPLPGVQTQLLSQCRAHPGHVLLGLNSRDPRVHDVFRMDLASGRLECILENPGRLTGWLFDATDTPRAALGPRADGGMDLLVRHVSDDRWEPILTWSPEDALSSGVLGWTAGERGVYLLDSSNAETTQLVELDLDTGTRESLAADPDADVTRVMIHPHSRKIQAVAFQRERCEWRVLDPSIETDFATLSRLAPGDLSVFHRDDSDRIWVVVHDSDTAPVSFHLYDRGRASAAFLFDHAPALRDFPLAKMEAITFRARDGLRLHGYLTQPIDSTAARTPLVVKVHSGPWSRDAWGFDPEVQWLANRGYACLQVNFRGSTGYGKTLLNAGNRQWGARMQDDLIDAVRWTTNHYNVDRDRVGIYGLSYGGFAALIGATHQPPVFACAVDIMGPTDLVAFLDDLPSMWEPYRDLIYERVGHPARDERMLRARSPITRYRRITIPVLIAHSPNDPRVGKEQSDRLVDALRHAGTTCEYMVFPGEGHGLGLLRSRLEFYRAVETFLARHLRPEATAPPHG